MTEALPGTPTPPRGGGGDFGTTEPMVSPLAGGLPLPSRIGRYELLELLGEGGMGTVYLAYDTGLRRQVALKTLLPHGGFAPDLRERLAREAELAGRLQHPGIVPVHDAGWAPDGRGDQLFYFVMDYVRGRTLRARLRAGPRPPWPESLELLRQVVAALAYAHAQGVLHRDVKPENVFLTDGDARALLGDFGLARQMDPATAQTASGIVGTLPYMSVEQLEGERLTAASDVYNVGVMMYETLGSRLPHVAPTPAALVKQMRTYDPLPLRRLAPEIPPDLESVVMKCLAVEPARRYASAVELGEDLERLRRGEPVRASRLTPVYRARRWLARRRLALLALALVLVAALAAALWVSGERRRRVAALQEEVRRVGVSVRALEDEARRRDMTAEELAGRARDALAQLERLAAEVPDFGPAASWSGVLRDRIGADGAEADFDRGCARSPECALVWYLRGRYRLGRYLRAHGLPGGTPGPGAEAARTARPESPEERAWRTGGVADLKRMLVAADPGDDPVPAADLPLGRACIALYGEDGAGGEAALRELAGVDGPPVWKLRGVVLVHLGRYEAAVAAFDHALGQWALDEETWGYRRHALLRGGAMTLTEWLSGRFEPLALAAGFPEERELEVGAQIERGQLAGVLRGVLERILREYPAGAAARGPAGMPDLKQGRRTAVAAALLQVHQALDSTRRALAIRQRNLDYYRREGNPFAKVQEVLVASYQRLIHATARALQLLKDLAIECGYPSFFLDGDIESAAEKGK